MFLSPSWEIKGTFWGNKKPYNDMSGKRNQEKQNQPTNQTKTNENKQTKNAQTTHKHKKNGRN